MSLERHEIIIAGRGGQGILLMGHILGRAFIEEGYYVVNSETYSAETRGGFSRSDIIIMSGEEEPDLIRIRRADIAVFLYVDQMNEYASLVDDNAIVFLDSSYISKPARNWKNIYFYPFSEAARDKLNNVRVANMVALGYFIGKTRFMKLETVKEIIKHHVKKEWIDINIKAVDLGYREAQS